MQLEHRGVTHKTKCRSNDSFPFGGTFAEQSCEESNSRLESMGLVVGCVKILEGLTVRYPR